MDEWKEAEEAENDLRSREDKIKEFAHGLVTDWVNSGLVNHNFDEEGEEKIKNKESRLKIIDNLTSQFTAWLLDDGLDDLLLDYLDGALEEME